jgi:hypothetical protein
MKLRSIQGGKGTAQVSSGAQTFCTPMGTSCSSILRSQGVKSLRSEQDWQASLHSFLSVSSHINLSGSLVL